MQEGRTLLNVIIPLRLRQALFIERLRQCCEVLEFTTDPINDFQYKIKKSLLIEMKEYIATQRGVLTPDVYPEIVNMVSCNVLRTLPPAPNPSRAAEYASKENTSKAAHPHIHFVYDFFLRFLEAPDLDADILRLYIDRDFVMQLLELFNSEDPEERIVLPYILHRIYVHFLCLRIFIRNQISNILYTFIYETNEHNGVSAFLQFLACIIKDFVLPLKEEHKMFLLKVLVPLHKVKTLRKFHVPLTDCVLEFLKKDPNLTQSVVNGLLKFWPKMDGLKERIFIKAIEEILDDMELVEFTTVMVPLFQQLSKCILSHNLNVAEAALKLWDNDWILTLIKVNSTILLPIVMPSLLYQHSNSHWKKCIPGLVSYALASFEAMNDDLFNECLKDYKRGRSTEKEKMKMHDDLWQNIESVASKNLKCKEIAPLNASQSTAADLPPIDEVLNDSEVVCRGITCPNTTAQVDEVLNDFKEISEVVCCEIRCPNRSGPVDEEVLNDFKVMSEVVCHEIRCPRRLGPVEEEVLNDFKEISEVVCCKIRCPNRPGSVDAEVLNDPKEISEVVCHEKRCSRRLGPVEEEVLNDFKEISEVVCCKIRCPNRPGSVDAEVLNDPKEISEVVCHEIRCSRRLGPVEEEVLNDFKEISEVVCCKIRCPNRPGSVDAEVLSDPKEISEVVCHEIRYPNRPGQVDEEVLSDPKEISEVVCHDIRYPRRSGGFLN